MKSTARKSLYLASPPTPRDFAPYLGLYVVLEINRRAGLETLADIVAEHAGGTRRGWSIRRENGNVHRPAMRCFCHLAREMLGATADELEALIAADIEDMLRMSGERFWTRESAARADREQVSDVADAIVWLCRFAKEKHGT